MPPYMRYNSAFNGIAYNPAIRYLPPVTFLANGTQVTYASMTGESTATGGNSAASASSRNWKQVPIDGFGVQSTGTSDLSNGVYAYVVQAGEYCTKPDLRTCNTQNSKDATYGYPAMLRWCTTANLTSCRATYDDPTNRYPRLPAPRISTFTVSNSGATSVSGIKVDGLEIMNGTATSSAGFGNSTDELARQITTQINTCSNRKTGNCGTVGYSATRNGSEVTIYAPAVPSTTPVVAKTGSMTVTPPAFARSNIPLPYWRDTGATPNQSSTTIPGENLRHTITPLIDSYPYPTYPNQTTKADGRDDCAGATCTYWEEMTNYANWYAYYQTRMQMTKTSASRAFAGIDRPADITAGTSRFRLGFMTLNNNRGSDFINLDEFAGQHKVNWYTKLLRAQPNDSTPLREALSKAGRLYAGRYTGTDSTLNGVTVVNPLQYSCQQNFTILSTDGFWNLGAGFKLDGSSALGNQDGAMPPPYNDGGITTTQKRTSSLQQSTETQKAEKGVLQSRTVTVTTRTNQLQKQTSRLQSRTRASSGSSWTAWADLPAGSSCTWKTNYPKTECQYVHGSWVSEPTSCAPDPKETGTSNNSTWDPAVACQYAGWTGWGGWTGPGSCTPAAMDTSGTWRTPVARECTTVNGTWNDTAACSVTTPDANGTSTQCQYRWITPAAATPTCSPAAPNDFSSQTVYRNCTTTNSAWTSATTCTAETAWSASGTRSACEYSGWTGWTTDANCTPVVQSTGPSYTVATAAECQTTSTSGGFDNTLADVAAYYYNTDLRRPASDNPPATDVTGTCTGPNGKGSLYQQRSGQRPRRGVLATYDHLHARLGRTREDALFANLLDGYGR